MKIITYVCYGLWAVTAITLKILGLVSWWVATSWLWFPIAMGLSFLTFLNVAIWVGKRLNEREDAKIPDSCENCLFGQTARFAENEQCLGEVLDEKNKRGTICPSYKRHIIR